MVRAQPEMPMSERIEGRIRWLTVHLSYIIIIYCLCHFSSVRCDSVNLVEMILISRNDS